MHFPPFVSTYDELYQNIVHLCGKEHGYPRMPKTYGTILGFPTELPCTLATKRSILLQPRWSDILRYLPSLDTGQLQIVGEHGGHGQGRPTITNSTLIQQFASTSAARIWFLRPHQGTSGTKAQDGKSSTCQWRSSRENFTYVRLTQAINPKLVWVHTKLGAATRVWEHTNRSATQI